MSAGRHVLRAPPREFAARAFNAPTPPTGPFAGPFSLALARPKFRADKPFTRGLDRPAEWSIRNPFGSDGGDPNTLAPNRLKARPCP